MSQPINNRSGEDKLLDEYLAGDSPFSQRYREMPAHDVPPELDAKILATSKAPARRSALSRWRVWSAPVALAATLVITVAVILRGGIEQAAVKAPELQKPVEVTTRQEFIAPAAPPPAATAVPMPSNEPAPPAAKSVTRDKFRRDAKPKEEDAEVQSPLPIDVITSEDLAPKPTAAPAPEARRTEPIVVTAHNRTAADEAATMQETVVTGTLRRAQPAAGAGPRNTVEPAEKSERTLAKEARESDPGLWLGYIRDLRKNNEIRAADREWKAFVKAYPDYLVAEDDLARPPTK
jgi:hypothetical protein